MGKNKNKKSFGRKAAETTALATLGSFVGGTVGTVFFGPAGGIVGAKLGAIIGGAQGMADGGGDSGSYDHISSGLDKPGGYFGDPSSWIG